MLFTVTFAFPSVALWPIAYGWEEIVGGGVVVTFAVVFVLTVVDVFVVTVADAFDGTFGDVFVFITVVGTGIVVTFAGAVVSTGAGVCVVFWVGSVVCRAGAGVVFEEWFVPDIIPEMNAPMTTRKTTATIAIMASPARDFRLLFRAVRSSLLPVLPVARLSGPACSWYE
jgi:hypothetical protein